MPVNNCKERVVSWWVRRGYPKLDGESDEFYAVRIFRQYYRGGGDGLFELLTLCLDLEEGEAATLAHGTLWRGDDPGCPDSTFEECVESFIRALARHRPQILSPGSNTDH